VNKQKRRLRSERGLLGTLLMIFGLAMVALFACLAIDVAHYASAQSEMQDVQMLRLLPGVST